MKNHRLGIIGGGLAGLSTAILGAKAGFEVTLFEKNAYPFHRVCGEYISLESWGFLESLGLPLSDWQLPMIKKLEVSSPKGTVLSSPLALGGFGISRFKLDHELSLLAIKYGVKILENHTVSTVEFHDKQFHIQTNEGPFVTDFCLGTFGKKAQLDLTWRRPFVYQTRSALNNYIGIKYHIKGGFDKDKIVLHNFKDGYCGMSAVEDHTFCLCYLTTAQNLRDQGNSIKQLEQNVLCKNPHLKAVFENAEFLFTSPISISNISFEKKSLVENHVLLIGDAAGSITPLCGNGMSMALHGAKMAFGLMHQAANGHLDQQQLETTYQKNWKQQFERRMWVGRQIQAQFGNETQTETLISVLKYFPFLVKSLIKQTHGKPF